MGAAVVTYARSASAHGARLSAAGGARAATRDVNAGRSYFAFDLPPIDPCGERSERVASPAGRVARRTSITLGAGRRVTVGPTSGIAAVPCADGSREESLVGEATFEIDSSTAGEPFALRLGSDVLYTDGAWFSVRAPDAANAPIQLAVATGEVTVGSAPHLTRLVAGDIAWWSPSGEGALQVVSGVDVAGYLRRSSARDRDRYSSGE